MKFGKGGRSMKIRLAAYPLLAMGAMLMMSVPMAAQNPDSANISTLLQHAKEHAVQAHADAEKIESYTRSTLSWRTHSDQIARMRDNINRLGKDVAALSGARAEGSPWQQDAIDHIDPLLQSMADHLSAMIQHLNENQNRVHMPPYVDYARANYQLSEKLLATIRDYADYAEAKSQTESLEQKLELAPNPAEGEE